MAETTLKTRIVLNNKTESDWASSTYSSQVPLKGEVCIYSDLRKIKIGDGTTTIANLKFANLTPEEVETLITASSHSHSNKTILDATTASFTTALLTKLNGIAEGATKITVDSALSSSSTNPVQNKVVNSALNGKVPTSRTVNGKALSANITLSASDVGADASGAADTALASAKEYTNEKIDALVGEGASETLDTIGEIASAIEENQDMIDTLNEAIGSKAPTNHASTATTYGIGTGSNYGHVKLSDSTSSTSAASAGIAASPKAVKAAYDAATAAQSTADSKVGAVSLTSGTNNGTVKLTVDGVSTDNIAVKGLGSAAYTDSSAYNLSKGTDTSGTATTLTHGGTFNALTDTTVSGHTVTDVVTTFTLPSETKLSKGTDATASKSLSFGGTFAAVTDTAVSNHKITDTTTTFTMPEETVLSTGSATGTGSLSHGGTFTAITGIAVDGHKITPTTTTYTLPTDDNTDTKVTNTVNNTTKAYITGTTSASTNTGTQVFDTNVYLDTTAGMLTATTFKGALSGNAETATSATSATKLATARNINVTGACTATAASFNGTAAANINVTAVNAGYLTQTSGDVLILDGTI